MKIKIYNCPICNKQFTKQNSLEKTCGKGMCKLALDKQKRIKVKEQKKMSISALSKVADVLWSKVIRKDGFCEHCYKKEFLNAHHIIGRNAKNTRWELSNGICLCSGCHTFSSEFSAHKNPYLFSKWLEQKYGIDYMQKLMELSHIPLKVTPEYLQEKIHIFKEILDN